jgi:hypothetical protein
MGLPKRNLNSGGSPIRFRFVEYYMKNGFKVREEALQIVADTGRILSKAGIAKI